MREIVVISGKGGTGKTSVCASLAHLAQNKVVCDLDVDAPDMHILLVRRSTPARRSSPATKPSSTGMPAAVAGSVSSTAVLML